MIDSDYRKRSALKAIVPCVHQAARVLEVRQLGELHTIAKLLRTLADRMDEVAGKGSREDVALVREAWRQLKAG